MAVALLLSACGTGGSVVNASSDKENGRKLFQEKCAGCHTLAAAGSTATIGPNLDDSFAESRYEGFKESAILDIVHDQIKFPGQYPVKQNDPEYLQANMPANLVTRAERDRRGCVCRGKRRQGRFRRGASRHRNERQADLHHEVRRLSHAEGRGDDRDAGPNLDLLKPSFAVAKNQVIHGGGIMPAFKGVLTDAQINAVAKYVADHAGK